MNGGNGGSGRGHHGSGRGHRNGAGTPPPPPAAAPAFGDRFLFVTQCLAGATVEVTLKSGHVYEGLFKAFKPTPEVEVALNHARLIRLPDGRPPAALSAPAPLHVRADLFAMLSTKASVGMDDDALNPPATAEGSDLPTDGAIARGRGGSERELTKWQPEGAGDGAEFRVLAPPGGRGAVISSGGGWDQFATNETLFGVSTSYDESIYTTKLDRAAVRGISEADAARLADEIRGGACGGNSHLAEERGYTPAAGDDGGDEEDRFSSVARPHGARGGGPAHVSIDSFNGDTFGGDDAAAFRAQGMPTPGPDPRLTRGPEPRRAVAAGRPPTAEPRPQGPWGRMPMGPAAGGGRPNLAECEAAAKALVMDSTAAAAAEGAGGAAVPPAVPAVKPLSASAATFKLNVAAKEFVMPSAPVAQPGGDGTGGSPPGMGGMGHGGRPGGYGGGMPMPMQRMGPGMMPQYMGGPQEWPGMPMGPGMMQPMMMMPGMMPYPGQGYPGPQGYPQGGFMGMPPPGYMPGMPGPGGYPQPMYGGHGGYGMPQQLPMPPPGGPGKGSP